MKTKHLALLWGIILCLSGFSVFQMVAEYQRKKQLENAFDQQRLAEDVLKNPRIDDMDKEDEQVLLSAFENPELLDSNIKTEEQRKFTENIEPRPQLLSEVQRSEASSTMKTQALVKAESLYFWNDFKSLHRNEASINGATEKRSATKLDKGSIELIKARQRRLGQVRK